MYGDGAGNTVEENSSLDPEAVAQSFDSWLKGDMQWFFHKIEEKVVSSCLLQLWGGRG